MCVSNQFYVDLRNLPDDKFSEAYHLLETYSSDIFPFIGSRVYEVVWNQVFSITERLCIPSDLVSHHRPSGL